MLVNNQVAVKISSIETDEPQNQTPARSRRLSGSNPVSPTPIGSPGSSGGVNKLGTGNGGSSKGRRLSSCEKESSSSVESDNFLTVPQTVTASSSAETLTGK